MCHLWTTIGVVIRRWLNGYLTIFCFSAVGLNIYSGSTLVIGPLARALPPPPSSQQLPSRDYETTAHCHQWQRLMKLHRPHKAGSHRICKATERYQNQNYLTDSSAPWERPHISKRKTSSKKVHHLCSRL